MADKNANILNDYYGATWHFQVKLGSYIIAESAKTTISIKSASIETSYTSSVRSHAPIATKISMQWFEPMGAMLYDNIMAILEKVGFKTLGESYWRINVWFCGWDQDGNPQKKLSPVQYKCIMTNISSILTEQGSEYEVEFAPLPDSGQKDEWFIIPSNLQIKDPGDQSIQTVKQVCDKLIDSWNDHVKTTNNDQLVKYSLTFDKWIDDPSPENWKIINDKPSQVAQCTDLGANAGKGQGIDAFIHMLISQTKEGALAATQHPDDQGTYVEKPGKPYSTMAVVTTIVKLDYGTFNVRVGKYHRTIQFSVRPFQTCKCIANQKHAQALTNGDFSSQILGWLKSKNRIPRLYNYIFTGLNQDILKLDIKFNGTQIINQQYKDGQSTETQPGKSRQRQDDKVIEFQRAKQGPSQKDPPPTSGGGSDADGDTYMDDVDLSSKDTPAMRQVSCVFTNVDPQHQTLGQGEGWPTKEKPAYGHVLEQFYENQTGFLVELDMDIRGDPFWLGPNAETGNNKLIDNDLVSSGDIGFAVRVRVPLGHPAYNDDTNQPNLQPSSFYTGLYRIISCTSKFEADGKFTQSLHGARIFPVLSVDAQGLYSSS